MALPAFGILQAGYSKEADVPSDAPRAGPATRASRPSVDRAALIIGAALVVVAVLAWVGLLR
jgi:hypothetical protein